MDNESADRFVPKDINVYTWNNKQEGKDQYARFVSDFTSSIKHLRYLLEPGAVQRRLGDHPGPQPVQVALRREWKEDMRDYQRKVNKVDEHFATALGTLENSFFFETTPRHIIRTATEQPPLGVPVEQWTYQMKFEAAWEALRLEYQPSTAVDLSQLREQIFALNDQGPGGFDTFRSEFHRLHAEILATRVPDAILPRELNGIVREGIKNQTVWGLIGYRLYEADPNAPWERTFEAVANLLTSFRSKGMDPYGENKSGPILGYQAVGANLVAANAAEATARPMKRPTPSRDQGGRYRKAQRTTSSDPAYQGKPQWPSSQTGVRRDPTPAPSRPAEVKCSRCWNSTEHSYRECSATKCVCGNHLSQGQVVCFNYDAHPATAKFKNGLPRSVSIALEAYRKGKAAAGATSGGSHSGDKSKNTPGAKAKGRGGKKNTRAFVASIVADELARRGASDESLDHSA